MCPILPNKILQDLSSKIPPKNRCLDIAATTRSNGGQKSKWPGHFCSIAVTILMLHKQKYFIYIGSRNEVILSKICGKYEFNCMKNGKI